MRNCLAICVVDDDGGVRESLRSLLRAEGMAVVTFPDAESVLLSPLLRYFDCFLSDLNMAAIDGLELHRLLKERDFDAPFFLMTACLRPKVAEWAALNGVTILEKPMDPDVLMSELERTLHDPA